VDLRTVNTVGKAQQLMKMLDIGVKETDDIYPLITSFRKSLNDNVNKQM
jgi:hypothetical protein